MSEWTISPDALKHVCPNLRHDDAVVIARGLGEAFRRYDITTRARAAMAIAQWAHESANFSTREEFASGEQYEGRRDLGNTQPGDGKRFKGRGRIQITGRTNYMAIAKALSIDCVKQPAILATSPHSEIASGQWWQDHACNAFCDRDDFIGLTKRINGGLNGLDDRQRLLARARNVAGDLVPRDRWAVLSDVEREQLEILATERKIAERNGGWDKVDPSHLALARKAKAWLNERVVAITKLAEAESNGWVKGGRRTRVAIMTQAVQG
jgi:predicted chitinase